MKTGEVYHPVTGADWTWDVLKAEGELKRWSDIKIDGVRREGKGSLQNEGRLDQPEARPLVADSIVGNAFPDKGLNSLAVVAAEVHKSNRKLVA